MPEESPALSPLLTGLTQGIGKDLDRLIGEHVKLLRAEVREALGHLEGGAVAVGAGAGLTALGGVLGTLMLVHLLNRVTRLPLWVCYGLAAAGLGGAGVALLSAGGEELAQITRLVPFSRTTAARRGETDPDGGQALSSARERVAQGR